jgi:hypothetical protein
LKRDRLVIPDVNKTMTSFRGQASSAKIESLRGKLTALACHPTERVNKAEELTFLSSNIAMLLVYILYFIPGSGKSY